MSRDEQGRQKQKMTFGLIVGNRGFFPDHLAKSGREEMLREILRAASIDQLFRAFKLAFTEAHDANDQNAQTEIIFDPGEDAGTPASAAGAR